MFRRKKLNKQADDALALLISGLILALMMCGIVIFAIMNIVKIGQAILMFGLAILAIGGGVYLIRRGWKEIQEVKQ